MRHYIQRALRGYSDQDAWSANDYLARVIPGMLRKQKKGYGYPESVGSRENWEEILEDIAQGFEAAEYISNGKSSYFVEEDGMYVLKLNDKALKEATIKMEKGLQLFAKHYLNLWD